MIRYLLPMFIGFSSGLIVSSAVFAFITAIGVVPRLAQKTKTQSHAKLYENAIGLGGLFGAVAGVVDLQIPLAAAIVAVIAISVGVFYGVLAMSLAEVLNVIPIMTRRIHLQKGMFFFVLAIALGKLCGALLYALVPGFYTPS